jgi:hypothetical protein
MTTEAYLRAATRESKLWPPFLYAAVFTSNQTVERAIIFGLYSGGYQNQHAYLLDIEAIDLANLLADYNSKIAGLTNEETIVLNSIVAKRYVATVEQLIHDQEITTKTAKVDADSAELEAKIAALSADRAALLTLQTRLDTETTISHARVDELTAQLSLETLNLSLAEIENSKKEIELEEVKIRILNVANEVLRYQIGIVEAGLELVETDVKIARTNIEIENIKGDLDKTDILTAEKDSTQFHLDSTKTEAAILQIELDMVGNKQTLADNEETDLNLLETSETTHKSDSLDLLDAKYKSRYVAREITAGNREVEIIRRDVTRDWEIENIDNDVDIRDESKAGHIDTNNAQMYAASALKTAAITAATTLAKANITSVLTHSIAKAPG